MPRYVINYRHRPAGQQISGATLFYAANDAAAQAIAGVIDGAAPVGAISSLTKASVVVQGVADAILTEVKNARVNMLAEDGDLHFMQIPSVMDTVTDNAIEAAILGGGVDPVWAENNSPITKIVKIERVNPRTM